MADTIIKNAFPDIDEVWGIEAKLYFPELYAGTSDLVGIYKGKPAIMDYKTAKKIRTLDQITDYMCQGSAYALAHNYHYGTDITQIAIFMVSRDLSYKTFEISGNEYHKYADEWRRRLEEYETKIAG
jgi:genome maintenance exonuclease 1